MLTITDTERIRQLEMLVEDLEHELKLARRHLDRCPTAQAIAEHDRDKALENR